MTREHKISLILGFAVVLVVGVLLSDHLSGARKASLDTNDPGEGIIQPRAYRDSSQSDLVLVEKGAKVRQAQALDTVAASPERDTVTTDSGEGRQSGLEWIRDQTQQLFADIRNGNTPPSAAQLDTSSSTGIPTLDMGSAYRAQRTLLTDPDGADFVTHTVQPGESLWSLAERYLGDGRRHRELAAMNQDRLGSDGSLRVGTRLRIPVPVATEADSSTTRAEAEPSRHQGTEASTYVVKKGDTLSEISQRLLGTFRRMDEIISANSESLASAEDLQAGMVLTIPPR